MGNPDGGFAEGDQREDLGLAAVGSFLTDNGTYIVDISDETDPQRIAHVPLEDTRNADVKFHPSRKYVFRTNEANNEDGKGGFEVIDVTEPEEPEIVAFFDDIAGHGVHNVTPYGDDYLLLSGTGEGMVVVDVSAPDEPTRVTNYVVGDEEHTHTVHDVTVRDDLAFVAHWDAGLRIVDLSDPSEPTEIATFDYHDRDYQNCHFARAHPSEDYVVVGDEVGTGEPGPKHLIEFDADAGTTEELAVFRAPQQNANQPTGRQSFWWTGHNFDFGGPDGDILFSGDYKAGVQVFDLSDPSNPDRIDKHYPNEGINEVRREDTGGFVDSVPFTWGAKVQDSGRIYATDMQTGLYVFEWGGE